MATNLWASFKRMIAAAPMVVVTVISVDTVASTSMVTTAGGGVMRVRGKDVAVGKKAYVKDGAIVGEAPNLQHYEIEV